MDSSGAHFDSLLLFPSRKGKSREEDGLFLAFTTERRGKRAEISKKGRMDECKRRKHKVGGYLLPLRYIFVYALLQVQKRKESGCL